MVGQRCDESLESRDHGCDRGLLEHDFAEPHAIRVGRRCARRSAPRQASRKLSTIMCEQAICGIGGHGCAMAWSRAMAKTPYDTQCSDAPRRGRARRPATWSATSAEWRSSGSASSKARWSAAGAKSSASATPRSPRPNRSDSRRQEIGGHADLAGRGRACAADAASDPADHRAGQSLFRLSGDRPDGVPPGQAAAQPAAPKRPSSGPVPQASLAKACAKSPIPNLGLASHRLLRELAGATAVPSVEADDRQFRTRSSPE